MSHILQNEGFIVSVPIIFLIIFFISFVFIMYNMWYRYYGYESHGELDPDWGVYNPSEELNNELTPKEKTARIVEKLNQ